MAAAPPAARLKGSAGLAESLKDSNLWGAFGGRNCPCEAYAEQQSQ